MRIWTYVSDKLTSANYSNIIKGKLSSLRLYASSIQLLKVIQINRPAAIALHRDSYKIKHINCLIQSLLHPLFPYLPSGLPRFWVILT